MKLKAQNQYNRNKSVNYYQGYHNTTRKNYHQKNDALVKKEDRGQKTEVRKWNYLIYLNNSVICHRSSVICSRSSVICHLFSASEDSS